MILLDTNIISELMKKVPSANVINWLDQQDVTQLFITSITIAEISYGLNALPTGERRRYLEDAFNKSIRDTFKHRILFFDETAAHQHGKLMSHRKQLGKPLSILDGQIAAVVSIHGASLATRNVRDFSDCEIDLINPF